MMPLQDIFKIISISLDIYSVVIGLLILVYLLLKHSNGFASFKWFSITLISSIVMALSDVFTFLHNGSQTSASRIILPVAMFIYYAATFLVMFAYVYYILDSTSFVIGKKTYQIIAHTGFLIYTTLLVVNIFTGIIFKFDENNTYQRGKFFYFSLIMEFGLYLTLLIFFIKNHRKATKQNKISFYVFLVIPLSMQALQLYFQGLSLVNVGYTIAFLIIIINMNNTLESVINVQTDEVNQKEAMIISMQEHTILSLSNLVESRDTDTGEHVKRTSAYVEMLATKLLRDNLLPEVVNPNYIALIEKAAPMHDIGKIVVSDTILKKPGRLTPEEFAEMQKHTIAGRKIVYQILTDYEDPDYVKICADIAAYHHEKWNGTGYPEHLKGEEIPLCARIMALADVFDALVSPRVYKAPMSYEEAFQIIEKDAGSHFDPLLAKEFLSIKDRIIAICESYKSSEELIHDLEELEEV